MRRRLRERKLLDGRKARAVLVEIQLSVEPQIVGVRPQEALDVRVSGEHVELLLFQGPEVLPADLRVALDLGFRDPAGEPRLLPISNTTPDCSDEAVGRPRLLEDEHEHGEDGQGERRCERENERERRQQPDEADEGAAPAPPERPLVLLASLPTENDGREREAEGERDGDDGVDDAHLVVVARREDGAGRRGSAGAPSPAPRRPSCSARAEPTLDVRAPDGGRRDGAADEADESDEREHVRERRDEVLRDARLALEGNGDGEADERSVAAKAQPGSHLPKITAASAM